jgi:hypothetical protein
LKRLILSLLPNGSRAHVEIISKFLCWNLTYECAVGPANESPKVDAARNHFHGCSNTFNLVPCPKPNILGSISLVWLARFLSHRLVHRRADRLRIAFGCLQPNSFGCFSCSQIGEWDLRPYLLADDLHLWFGLLSEPGPIAEGPPWRLALLGRVEWSAVHRGPSLSTLSSGRYATPRRPLQHPTAIVPSRSPQSFGSLEVHCQPGVDFYPVV